MNAHARSRLQILTSAIFLAAAIAGPSTYAVAEGDSASAHTLASLEKAYWACDYVASTKGIPSSDPCYGIAEQLKSEKFKGDFQAMLRWWEQNKAAARTIARAELAEK